MKFSQPGLGEPNSVPAAAGSMSRLACTRRRALHNLTHLVNKFTVFGAVKIHKYYFWRNWLSNSNMFYWFSTVKLASPET